MSCYCKYLFDGCDCAAKWLEGVPTLELTYSTYGGLNGILMLVHSSLLAYHPGWVQPHSMDLKEKRTSGRGTAAHTHLGWELQDPPTGGGCCKDSHSSQAPPLRRSCSKCNQCMQERGPMTDIMWDQSLESRDTVYVCLPYVFYEYAEHMYCM